MIEECDLYIEKLIDSMVTDDRGPSQYYIWELLKSDCRTIAFPYVISYRGPMYTLLSGINFKP